AVRIPGHTYGSMAWYFQTGGKSYVSFGDLIMPRGVLGYSGSVNFSARDVLSSLRKLQALKPDVVLPGHGATGGPGNYLDAGVEVGVAGGWGLVRPEKPDPYFRISQKNVVVGATCSSAAAPRRCCAPGGSCRASTSSRWTSRRRTRCVSWTWTAESCRCWPAASGGCRWSMKRSASHA